MSKLYPNFTSFILTKVIKKINSLLEIFLKRSIRRIAIKNDVVKVTYFNSGAKLRLFNLDLHIGVIRDLKQEIMTHANVELISWSISNHNGIARKFLDVPDPVKFVNNKNWLNLDIDIRGKFVEEYGKFLKKFDGFIVTHTPSFIQLFEDLGKPILLLNSTRYEAPYTNDFVQWDSLNQSIQRLSTTGLLLAASNNKGDQAYLRSHAEIDSLLVPSVCDYVKDYKKGSLSSGLIFSRSSHLQRKVEEETRGIFRRTYDRFIPYDEIASAKAIVVFPQNISTMFLFEMATLGKTVLIPDRELIVQLAREGYEVLSELSYFQIHGLPTDMLADSDMNNYKSNSFFDRWLNHADFYDFEIMPNVRLFKSFSELIDVQEYVDLSAEPLNLRNTKLAAIRRDLICKYVEGL